MERTRPNAFTLIETVLSLGIVGIIAVSMTSIVLLTSKALPSSADADVVNVATRDAASRIASDLAGATAIKGLGASSITFTVPDRDGDGSEELFTYSWSGTPGDPLEWTYNGGDPISVAANITDFALSVDAAQVTQTVAGPNAWGPEVLLYDHEGAPTRACTVSGLNRFAQFIRPEFPAGTTGWMITRGNIQMRRAVGATSAPVLRVSFVTASITGTPDLGTFQLTVADTSGVTGSASWYTVPFTCATTPTYPVSQSMFLYAAPTTGTNALTTADIGATAGAASDPGYFTSTNTALLTWTNDADDGIACAVYGKFYGPTTTTQTADRAVRAGLLLQIGKGDTTRVTAQLLSRPTMP